MIGEKKLRKKLAEILERPAYRGLYTYSRQPLIDTIIKAVKETLPKPKPKTSRKGKKSD